MDTIDRFIARETSLLLSSEISVKVIKLSTLKTLEIFEIVLSDSWRIYGVRNGAILTDLWLWSESTRLMGKWVEWIDGSYDMDYDMD